MSAVAALPPTSAIVLAGGRSSRFGRDKLAEPIDGRPLLHHAVLAAAAVSREVLVLVRPVGDPPALPVVAAAGTGLTVRIVRDPEPFGGPLVALLAGLERAREPFALVVAGDMPALSADVLRLLLRALDAAEDMEAACLAFRGRRKPLPAAVRVGAGTPAARRIIAAGERSLTGLLGALRTRQLGEDEWRPLDPTAATLLDVDRPEDLPRD